ncbi:hypothetical protein IHQ68_19050 [Chelatococcus sambhunathii]|uniref:Hemolysin-type calcium-binding repeat (2 copies) n=1 Tax=Chelatococcus sambhunathii TaxID=363953 RepID=A0ABU1DKR7_9HYPH|nr:hypothetical protein [Chelatococcus sambhunathii]MDR4308723.1 hypothetical protein [Chelatococcus sambhunathii]
MTRTVIDKDDVRDERLDMSGADVLRVLGTFMVSEDDATVSFAGKTDGARIVNEGVIANTAEEGAAIRFGEEVGKKLEAEIDNRGLIKSIDDAIKIDDGHLTKGELSITNDKEGVIRSDAGQAIDLADASGDFLSRIANDGLIASGTNDAIKVGGDGRIDNDGHIVGGEAKGYSDGADGVSFEDGATGKVTNSGVIEGDRHGVDAGADSDITVLNRKGGVIVGHNGSGVGSDGSATVINYGRITGEFSDSNGSDTHGSTPGEDDGGGPDGINDGDGDGVDIDFEAHIFNFGVIEGTGAGGTGSDGLPNTSEGVAAGGGEIVNHEGAKIVGDDVGVLIDDSSQGGAQFETRIENHGEIVGKESFAIKLVGDQDDVIVNGGKIRGGDGIAIDFGGGDDRLAIEDGSRIIGLTKGGEGTDTLDYSGFGDSVDVRLISGKATGTGRVEGFENIVGSDQDDHLAGDKSGNRIEGGDGDDVLCGRGGADTLIGGDGDDVFHFRSAKGVYVDHVDDFVAGEDKISLGASFGLEKGDLKDAFVLGDAAHDASDRLVYDRKSGELFFDADGKGGEDAVKIAQFDPGTKIDFHDIVIG